MDIKKDFLIKCQSLNNHRKVNLIISLAFHLTIQARGYYNHDSLLKQNQILKGVNELFHSLHSHALSILKNDSFIVPDIEFQENIFDCAEIWDCHDLLISAMRNVLKYFDNQN